MRILQSLAIISVLSSALSGSIRAQSVLFSTGPGNTRALSNQTEGIAQRLTVSQTTTISSFGFWLGTFGQPLNVKFFVFDVGSNTKVYEQEKVLNVPNTTALTLFHTDPFALLLNAGSTYAFGFIGNGQFLTSVFSPGPNFLTQGAFSLNTVWSFYGPYSSPTLLRNGNGEGSSQTAAIEIRGAALNVVPEPSSFALLSGGAVLLGLVGRRLKGRAHQIRGAERVS